MDEIVTICLLVLSLVFQSSLSPYSFRLWLWLKVEFPEWAAGWLFILLGKVLEIAMLMKSRFRPGFACFLGRGHPGISMRNFCSCQVDKRSVSFNNI